MAHQFNYLNERCLFFTTLKIAKHNHCFKGHGTHHEFPNYYIDFSKCEDIKL